MMEDWAKVVKIWMSDNKVKENQIRRHMNYIKAVVKENNEFQEKIGIEKKKLEEKVEENRKLKEKIKDQSWKMQKLNKIVIELEGEIKDLNLKLKGNEELKIKTYECLFDARNTKSERVNRIRSSCPDILNTFESPNFCENCKKLLKSEQEKKENSQYISELKIQELEKKLNESFVIIKDLNTKSKEEISKSEQVISSLNQQLAEKILKIDQITKENTLNCKYFERKIKDKQIECSKLTEELEVLKKVNKRHFESQEKPSDSAKTALNQKYGKYENKKPIKILWNTPKAIRTPSLTEDENSSSIIYSKSDNESTPPGRLSPDYQLTVTKTENSLYPKNPNKASLYKIIISTPNGSPKALPAHPKHKTLKIQVSPTISP